MRTRTIFTAFRIAHAGFRNTAKPNRLRVHRLRQMDKFEAELLRRMDHYDEQRAAWHSIEEDPPIDTPLLLMNDDGSAHIAGYIHRWTGQLAYCNIDEDWGEDGYAKRTHWRTMPPPPTGTTYAELDDLYGPAGDK